VRYEVTLDDRRYRCDLTADGRFTFDDRAVAADVRELARGWQWSITVEGESHEVTLLTHDPLRVDIDGVEVRASVIDERALRAGRGSSANAAGRIEIRAPMPGLLKAVHVKEGDLVEQDASLATLEAMKMENELRAPVRGRVSKFVHAAGSKVEGGAVLAVIVAE
jgi:3-methylcrotonyl-CoA carboxylase alpha subunit